MLKLLVILFPLLAITILILLNAKTQPVIATPVDNIIQGEYIVVFNDNVQNADEAADNLAKTQGLSINHLYSHAIKGFSAKMSTQAAESLQKNPNIRFIAPNRTVSSDATTPTSFKPKPNPNQTIPTGVQRIGQNTTHTGTGITVAVLDSGIDLNHPDLQANIVTNKSCMSYAPTADDDFGHGTHVSGTIAAINNRAGVVGVAPGAKLAAVKVLDSTGRGTWDTVICGIDWATANAAAYNIKVANMSLSDYGASDNNCGLTNNDPVHLAICNSTNTGITYVVSAGNLAIDASLRIPAAYDDTVITVSALQDWDGKPGGLYSSDDDIFWSSSDYGSVVDLAAPGVHILSTWIGGNYAWMDGTSMATPHVSAAAAIYLQTHPSATWNQVRDALKATAEPLNSGHTDPSGLHPEPVVLTGKL